MTDSERLTMVKASVEIGSSLKDAYLSFLIKAAEEEIGREGIILDRENISDENLIVMYASYLYRKRAGDEQAMPRMLRYALNNRLFKQEMEGV